MVTVSNCQRRGTSREAQVSKNIEPVSVAAIDVSSPLMLVDLEPFVESPGYQCFGRASDAFRFGYRCKKTGACFATIEIPASTVAQFIQLKASVRVTIDGKLLAEYEMPNDGARTNSSEAVSLVQLIEEAMQVDNLRMEEASPRELNNLLQQLEISIQRVKAALLAMHVHEFAAAASESGQNDSVSEVSNVHSPAPASGG